MVLYIQRRWINLLLLGSIHEERGFPQNYHIGYAEFLNAGLFEVESTKE
jgi:hypothetical protein